MKQTQILHTFQVKDIDDAVLLGKSIRDFKVEKKFWGERIKYCKRKIRKMWASVIHVSLQNESSRPGFSSFSFISFTCISSRKHMEQLNPGLLTIATKVLDGLTLEVSEKKKKCTVGKFFQVLFSLEATLFLSKIQGFL